MEKIIVDIRDIYDYILEIGQFIDVDFNHLPFTEFIIRNNISNKIKEAELKYEIEKAFKMDKEIKINNNESARVKLDPFTEIRLKRDYSKIENIKKELLEAIKKDYKIDINVFFNKDDNSILFSTDDFIAQTIPLTGIKTKDDREEIYNNLKIQVSDEILNKKASGNLTFMQEKSINEYILGSLITILGVIGFIQMDSESIEIEQSKEGKEVKKKSSKKKNKKKQKRISYITKKTYHLSKPVKNIQNTIDKENSSGTSKRQYTLSEWYQRGHWRRYKNGKTIWIKGCFKHPRNKQVKEQDDFEKIYKLK